MSLPGLLGQQAREQNLRDRSKIGAEAIGNGLISKTSWGKTAEREAFFNTDAGMPYAQRWNDIE